MLFLNTQIYRLRFIFQLTIIIYMGVKNLFSLIKSVSPKSIQSLTIDSLTEKTVAIDASIVFYEFLTQMNTFNKGT